MTHSEDHKGGPGETHGAFLGTLAWVVGAERNTIALGLARESVDTR